MPPADLNQRKKEYVQELNGFIGLKKAYSSQQANRGELLSGAKSEGERMQGGWMGGWLAGWWWWGGGCWGARRRCCCAAPITWTLVCARRCRRRLC